MNKHLRKSTGSPDMTSEDSDVWHSFTREIKPLRRFPGQAADPPGLHHGVDPPASKESADPRDCADSSSLLPEANSRRSTTGVGISEESPLPPLKMGATPGLDRRTAIRLRRGKFPIEATLDLHGYRRDTAQRAVEEFISQSVARGRRCVLVITGKGNTGKGSTSGNVQGWPGPGVLKAALPDWLNAPSIRPFILDYNQAQPGDGGGGAFYVLLHRPR